MSLIVECTNRIVQVELVRQQLNVLYEVKRNVEARMAKHNLQPVNKQTPPKPPFTAATTSLFSDLICLLGHLNLLLVLSVSQ